MHRGYEQADFMEQQAGGWNPLPSVNTLQLILSFKPNGIFRRPLFNIWQGLTKDMLEDMDISLALGMSAARSEPTLQS